MEIQPECYPCILKMVGTLAEDALGEREAAEFLRGIEAGEAFQGNAAGHRAPLIVRDVWTDLVERLGDDDPLADLKRRQNEAAQALLPAAREAVAASADPLASAVVLAVIGNALDVLVPGQPNGDRLMARLTTARLEAAPYEEFRRRVAAARTIVYLGDNCGEAVFDGLLIETLDSLFDVKITYVVRARPALNDITMKEARAIGLDRVARLVDNGIEDALPSTLLGSLGPEAGRAVAEADLLISKGGGNYELLDGDPALAGRVSFLVDGKCVPLCRRHGVAAGTPIVHNQ